MVGAKLAPSGTTEISSEFHHERDPIIVVLDKKIQSLPWESMGELLLQRAQKSRPPLKRDKI